jgi:lipopolysaccharide transport system ATP-binding protein
VVTVRLDDVSKRYQLGPAAVPLRTLVPLVGRRGALAPPREVWALRGISFDAQAGSVTGIIGPNGAGKSTLLKIMARVTRPTSGRVELRGRVVPLLELGGTFQPDASGRENVYLQASLQGTPRQLVKSRIDDIVEFAGIGGQIDAPVGTYSSGMILRLAFAVAVSIDPDVLIADEVLAVGDLAFQQQCARRIAAGAAAGMTVIMVSHDLDSVQRLCDRAIWIGEGNVVADGAPAEVVDAYVRSVDAGGGGLAGSSSVSPARPSSDDERANEFGEIVAVTFLGPDGDEVDAVSVADESQIRLAVRVDRPGIGLRCIVAVSAAGVDVFRSVQPEPVHLDARGMYHADVRVPAHLLAEATYSVKAGVWITRDGEERREDALVWRQTPSLRVIEAPGADPTRGSYAYPLAGVVRPLLVWTIAPAQMADDDLAGEFDAA